MAYKVSTSAAIPMVIIAAAVVCAGRPAAQAPDPARILQAARDAIGGDARVRGVKSLRVTGTKFATQGVVGGYTHDTDEPFEWRFVFPDRFLEVSVFRAGALAFEDRKGFAGARTISVSNGEATNPPGEAVYVRKKAAELLLILLARTESWGGLALEAAGANAINVKGLDGYTARLEFNPATHALEKLTYRERRQVRPRNTILRKGQGPGRSTDAAGGGGARAGGAGDFPLIDIATTFHDHRKIDGILMPHRITTTAVAANLLLWEWRIEKVAVNPPLTDADFGK